MHCQCTTNICIYFFSNRKTVETGYVYFSDNAVDIAAMSNVNIMSNINSLWATVDYVGQLYKTSNNNLFDHIFI